MSGWTVVDADSNKSLPIQGTGGSGVAVPYIAPSPASQDAVGKMRVSTPQSLIDTDFEYGTQPTKWETIGLQNNRASVYYNSQAPVPVTAITGTATADQISITCGSTTIANNTPIYIQNSTNSTINGWGFIIAGGTGTNFTVRLAPGSSTTTNGAEYFSATSTYVYTGTFFSNCGIQVGANCVTVTSSTVLTITTTGSHGLSKGSYVYIRGLGGTNTGQLGAFVVATVPTSSTFTVTTVGAVGPSTNSAGNLTVYARPSGYVEPRAFDGGVAFSAGAVVPDQQLVRQTRRYFRYQSGKGIQFSTGSSLQPPLFITSLTAASNVATVTTRYQHNLVIGTTIQVAGAAPGGFNGTYTVTSIPTPTTFTYATSISGTVTATGPAIKVTPTKWFGSQSRLGFFDNQNGMFFEYDGQTLYTVQRSSISQLNGTVSVTQGSGAVTGTGTSFLTQVLPGQFIVIRGQSYRVVDITNDTTMSISPEYRGQSIAGAIVSLTIDLKTPQSQWDDPCNGTGPSGYNLDLTRMQMWYIDYSWYGAGFIRWGLRGPSGQIIYVNQQTNNNKQFEAYMRTGNMAAHYEVSGIAPTTYAVQSLSASQTTTTADVLITALTIPIADTSVLDTGGGVVKLGTSELVYYGGLSTASGAGNLINCIRGFGGTKADDQTSGAAVVPSSIQIDDTNGFAVPGSGTTTLIKVSNASVIEYISYSGITNTGIIYGLTRGVAGGAGTAQSFAAGVATAVQYAGPDAVPALSHWGSSAIMDGLYNDDKSLIFNYGTPKLTTTGTLTQVTPILAIRVAPSVDNGLTGIMGNKETINRMQLTLVQLGLYSTGPLLVNLILNGYTATATYSGTFQSPVTQGVGATTSSLAQIAANNLNTVTLVGGESVAAAFTNTNGETTLDLSQVRDLGNAILGGGNSLTVPNSPANTYPDGPDILYVCVTPLVAACDVYARLSWKEAQA